MTKWLKYSAFAIVVILGVLWVFLFPSHAGAFSVTHGPATAFRARAAARALFASIGTALLMALLSGSWLTRRRHGTAMTPAVEPGVLSLRC